MPPSHLARRVILTGVSLLALSAPTFALAQSVEVETLVITGSRLRAADAGASPVRVIDLGEAALRGQTNLSEILQTSALASGSPQINNQMTAWSSIGAEIVSPGANYISLRGLGAQRTLVLLDGRRLGPAGAGGLVGAFDLNVLPASLVSRVEVLKDGGSSIYGSDAVAGVVNLVTRANSEGLELTAHASLAQDGGGSVYQASLLWGKGFDRGHLTVAADYSEQQALRLRQREDLACAADYLFAADGSGRIDHQSATNPGNAQCYNIANGYVQTASWGTITPVQPSLTYPTVAQGNGGASPLPAGFVRYGRAGYPSTFAYGPYDSPLYGNATVISPVRRATVYVAGGYDLSDTAELFGELLVNRRESSQTSVGAIFPSFAQRSVLNGALNALPANNPNNPFGQPVVPVIAYASPSNQTIDYTRLVGGARGEAGLFGVAWDWQVFGQWVRSEASYDFGQRVYLDRLLATMSPATACTNTPAGGNVSGFACSALPGGVPWTSARVLGGNFTDAERAFLFFNEEGSTTYDHKYVEASAAGDLFTLPAGPVSAAAGVHFREEEIDDLPGLQARTRNMAFYSSAERTAGSDRVSEAFGELAIPLLSNAPLAERLTLNVSSRVSDYRSYGDSSTYKAAIDWRLTPSFRLRASQGTSFRAPTLYEQFIGAQTSYETQAAVDPCYNYGSTGVSPTIVANCAKAGVPATLSGLGNAVIYANGGAGVLTAETAVSRNLGVVWSPASLSIAIDYWEYDIKDEVRQFGARNILNQCYGRADYPTNAFCGLFVRSPTTFQVQQVSDSYINVADQNARGVDLDARWTRDDLLGGRLTLAGEFTWQLEDVTRLLAQSRPLDNNGILTQPDFSGQARAIFERGPWTLAWNASVIGKASDTEIKGGDLAPNTRYGCASLAAGCGAVLTSPQVRYKLHAEATAYHDVSVRFRHAEWTWQAGVRNLFDERPPAISTGTVGGYRAGVAAANLYDAIGRRAWVTIGKRF